jgi:hypothetical protein
VEQLLRRMPVEDAETFSPRQVECLSAALRGCLRTRHPLDIRFTLPVWRARYYLVLLAGRDRRALSRREEEAGRLVKAMALASFLAFSLLLGLLILYLIKSALGIDLFPNFSLGVWDWFKAAVEQGG